MLSTKGLKERNGANSLSCQNFNFRAYKTSKKVFLSPLKGFIIIFF